MRYVKPAVNVIDLQIKENIAATDVNSTVYTGSASNFNVKSMALGESTTGISNADSHGLVTES